MRELASHDADQGESSGEAEPAATPDEHTTRPRVPLGVSLFVVALVALAGVAYRIWLALGPLGRAPNSDETVVGLMALHLVRNHQLRAFFWHQTYGGTLETWLVAPFVGLFGTSVFALRAATTLEGIAAPVLTWLIARHLFSRRVAVWCGLVALWLPLSLIYFSTQERLFYVLTVLLGLVAVLMVLDIDEKPRLVRHWVVLGLCIGTGWWLSPDIIYYAIPIVVFLLVRGHWRQWRNVAISATTFVVGSSVWTYANLHSGFESLRSPDWAGSSTYWTRLKFFGETGLPFILGLRRTWSARWYDGAHAGRALYVAALVIVGVALVLALRSIRSKRSIILFLVVAAPLLYAYFPPTWQLGEGRYLYFAASIVPLLLGLVLQHVAGRVVVLAFVTIAGVAFVRGYGFDPRPPTPSLAPITSAIRANGYHTAITQYWIAFAMTYESGEHVIASPMPGQTGARYMPYIDAIRRSIPAYVFTRTREGAHDKRIRLDLEAAHDPYRIVTAGDYEAILPRRRFVSP